MRRKTKEQIIDILETLCRAQEYVGKLLEERQDCAAEATGLLAQCQEGAQKIGESIEQSEGEGVRAVSYLEEYCEVLYQLSQSLCASQVDGAVLMEKLDQLLKKIRREVEEALPTEPLKVLFLPYKASMWDCMESVWEAAEADGECEAKVVPIPYYELDDRGSVAKECYEGSMFPDYVPVTYHGSYKLREERPDIIYIHNPYDGGNTVTTVHPDYYASALKKYTDMLVYIPYFILGDSPMPDSHLSLPAYAYVDKIVVQDEDKIDDLADFVPREKIVALGSPKVDRILKLDRQKDRIVQKEICPEWREKIRGKKVILYNISITGLLRNSRYLLDKIRYVLSCFEGREDVVLWWRPHPLLEATLKSVMPQSYESYMEIKHAFARSQNGILDETGDAGVAAVIADAYLGENTSSLVHYFGVLGKPVLYTQWEITEDEKKDRRFLDLNTFYQEGEHLFFVPIKPGMGHDLYRIGLKDGATEKVMTFPGIPEDMWGCYYGIKKVRDKILLVPHNTEDVYVYDLEKKQGIKLVLAEAKGRLMQFDEAVSYREKVFLLPRCYPAIVSVDMESLEVREYKACVEPFLREDETEQMFCWAFLVRGSTLYLASCNESKILLFDMEDGHYEIKEIGAYPYGYYRMIHDGTYFWLSAFKTNRIVRWDEETGETREYRYPMNEGPSSEWAYYSSLVDHGEEIMVCYASSFDIVFMDKATGECRRRESIQGILDRLRADSVKAGAGFGYAKPLDDDMTLLFDTGSAHLIVLDARKEQWTYLPARLSEDEMLRIEKRLLERCWMIRAVPFCLREDTMTIPQFMDYIIKEDTDLFKRTYGCYQDEESDLAIGARIHAYVKKESIGRTAL